MSFKVKCPECPALIYQNATKCKCGWENKNVNQSIPVEMIRCADFFCQKRSFDLHRVNEKDYMCLEHFEDWIIKNQNDERFKLEAQRILLTRKFIQEAKDLGISNYEYFKKNCSGWAGVKDALISQQEKNNNSSQTVNLEDIEF